MEKTLRRIRAKRIDEQGFTLIELMVVVLIIAILIAIAIPTFLGARQRAQDRAAQSSLRNALASAKTLYTDNQDYTSATVAAMAEAEPSLTFVADTTASTSAKEVSIATPASNLVVMVSESASGKCFALRDNTQGPGTQFATITGTCDASTASGNAVTWADQW
jgi:type IV pilus assembly protein PilA